MLDNMKHMEKKFRTVFKIFLFCPVQSLLVFVFSNR